MRDGPTASQSYLQDQVRNKLGRRRASEYCEQQQAGATAGHAPPRTTAACPCHARGGLHCSYRDNNELQGSPDRSQARRSGGAATALIAQLAAQPHLAMSSRIRLLQCIPRVQGQHRSTDELPGWARHALRLAHPYGCPPLRQQLAGALTDPWEVSGAICCRRFTA